MKKKVNKEPVVTLDGKTKAQKKIIIAQDIIANIHAQIYLAKKGTYVENVTDGIDIQMEEAYNWEYMPVKENFGKIKSCNVCGIGACLMSITKFNNRLNFKDLLLGTNWDTEQLELLTEIFTPEELTMIELAFEGDWSESNHNIGRDDLKVNLSDTKIKKVIQFHELYNDDEARLVAIMESIINNKGVIKF